jgi:UTP-glucose-1-phosphate uridylyltransferase
MKPVRKAVLPVAGFGTRVLPATKAVPKEMLTVFDRPALQYVVDEAREAGIEHFVFITGRGKQAIEDYFDKAYELEATLEAKKKDAILAEVRAAALPPGASSFTRQQAALGLGHAVLCARPMVGDNCFVVALGDSIIGLHAQSRVVRTMIEDEMFGRMCSTITRNGEQPSAIAASTNGSLRQDRVSANTSRAQNGYAASKGKKSAVKDFDRIWK